MNRIITSQDASFNKIFGKIKKLIISNQLTLLNDSFNCVEIYKDNNNCIYELEYNCSDEVTTIILKGADL